MKNIDYKKLLLALMCIAWGIDSFAMRQPPVVERIVVTQVSVESDLEELVIDSPPENPAKPDVSTEENLSTDVQETSSVAMQEASSRQASAAVRIPTHFEIPASRSVEKQGDAADKAAPPVTIDLLGTLRVKFEYQPEESNAHFQVRNARFGIAGEIYSKLSYRMEVDLSNEGRITMVDAYVGLKLYKGLTFTAGQMRVPFTIDAHRAPFMQYFANRSFLAKQVGNVRDVGAVLGWKSERGIPVNIQIGMFNGSGVDDQDDFWTSKFNYSAKAQLGFVPGMNFVVSYQTINPDRFRIHLYDIGCSYQVGGWFFEAEYLRKEYSKGSFHGVNAFDGFFCYDLPLKRIFRKISFLGRYDYMTDHSNGIPNDSGVLFANDLERHRLTAGLTFSLGLPFTADIRLNYEKYFYEKGAIPGVSDHDKIVLEFMAHF